MTKQPSLNGRRVLITRDGKSANRMAKEVEDLGGIPLIAPVLSFKKVALSNKDLDDVLTHDWLVFTSANGVRHFFSQLKEKSLAAFPRLAVVGKKTADVLVSYGYKADLIPTTYSSKDLADAFSAIPARQTVAIIKGQLAKESLEEALRGQGHFVSSYIAYETVPYYKGQSHLREILMDYEIDVLTITSPSSLVFFLALSGFEVKDPFFDKVLIGCIGPETRDFARDQGLRRLVTPRTYTTQALIEAIANYYMEGSACPF